MSHYRIDIDCKRDIMSVISAKRKPLYLNTAVRSVEKHNSGTSRMPSLTNILRSAVYIIYTLR